MSFDQKCKTSDSVLKVVYLRVEYTRVYLRVGYTLGYMPPCTPWWVYTRLYASLYHSGRCTRPYTTRVCTWHVHPGIHRSLGECALLAERLKKRGKVSRETFLLTLRINLLPARKPPKRAKKPATERTFAQGTTESPNLSFRRVKLPSRS